MRFPACLAAGVLLALSGVAPSPFPMAAAAPAPATVPVPARTAAPLAAHRALYQLTLSTSGGQRQIVGAQGTMGYEMADVCDGWTTHQKLRLTLQSGEGPDVEMDSDYLTWESKDGLNFRFHMVQRTDGNVNEQTDGGAHLSRTGGPGEATYVAPKDKKIALPAGTLFPTMHTVAILGAAREGKKFLQLPLFDGTDDAGYEDSSIVVMDWKQPFATKYPVLTPLPSTRVRVAFFPHKPDVLMPGFEEAMRYWENGIADDMDMDFGDFVVHGVLTELTPLPRHC